jgi:ketosteroid isomerase-like protein
MSHQDSTEVVREAFLAINRGDEDAFYDRLAPDVLWTSAADGLVPRATLHGREAVREARRAEAEAGRHVHTSLHEIRARDDCVLLLGVVSSDIRQRGEVALPMAWICRVQNGTMTSIDSFTNRSEALRRWEAAT